jgi:lysozyme
MTLTTRATALALASVAAVVALWPRRASAGQVGIVADDLAPAGQPHAPIQSGDLAPVDSASWWSALPPVPALATALVDHDQAERNVRAFLAMIRTAEGTADANGYRALFGHTARRPRLFESFDDHPRIARQFTDAAGRRQWTSAAGAYQFMAISPLPGGGTTRVDTWGEVQRRLRLPDFSPESQDAAAVELIRQAGALGDVRAGRFEAAVNKVRGRWASLPGAGYDQPEQTMATVAAAYRQAGGTFA